MVRSRMQRRDPDCAGRTRGRGKKLMRRDPDCAVSNSRSFHRKAGSSVGRLVEVEKKKNCCGATPTVLYVKLF